MASFLVKVSNHGFSVFQFLMWTGIFTDSISMLYPLHSAFGRRIKCPVGNTRPPINYGSEPAELHCRGGKLTSQPLYTKKPGTKPQEAKSNNGTGFVTSEAGQTMESWHQ